VNRPLQCGATIYGDEVPANHAMLKLFLWLRYLRKKRIVFLSVAAVALSVALLIVVASLFTGFIDAFEQAAVEAIGDVVLFPPKRFAKYPLLIERLEQTETVEAATAMLLVPGLLHLGTGNVRPVEIWGIEPGRRAKVTGFKRFLLKQKDAPGEPSFDIPDAPEKTAGFVGIGVLGEPDEQTDEYDRLAAEKMLGQQVVLTTGTASETNKDDATRPQIKRRVMSFTIADILQTGVYQFDEACVYLPIEKLQKTLYPDDKSPTAGQILIKLADKTKPDTALAVIRGVWRSFVEEQLGGDPYLIQSTSIETAKELQRPYVAAYRKQMGVLLLIFGVVSIGVILLIFCIFYMIVRLKQKDIAIIKSCGATSRSVAWIFVGFGACVGAAGSGVGTVFGYLITKNINTIEGWIRIVFGLKLWRSSVYMFSRIPNEVDWFGAGRIVVLAIIAAAIGTLIPAIVAARTKPVEILRYE
jgi:ABC-type lipoprotein release transport system permease subunit